jgi:hypothetical protein
VLTYHARARELKSAQINNRNSKTPPKRHKICSIIRRHKKKQAMATEIRNNPKLSKITIKKIITKAFPRNTSFQEKKNSTQGA